MKKLAWKRTVTLAMLCMALVVPGLLLAQDQGEDNREPTPPPLPQQGEANPGRRSPGGADDNQRRQNPAERSGGGGENEQAQRERGERRRGGGEGRGRSRGRDRESQRPPERARPGAGSTAAPLGQLSLSGGGDTVLLRLAPEGDDSFSDIDATEGEPFFTDIMLMNPGNEELDGVRVVLAYNPAFLNPQQVNDRTLAEFLAAEPRVVVDRRLGRLIYEAELAEPIRELKSPMLAVRWEPKQPTRYTRIDFGMTAEGQYSEMFVNDQPMLGQPYAVGDGTLSIGVQISPEDPDDAEIDEEDALLYVGTSQNAGGVRLGILPPTGTPVVGEPFYLDLVMDNSAYSMMDSVSVMLEYDPEVLEILDYDLDNWVTLGHNIQDGLFRNNFAFDYHIANAVYPTRGLIEYRVGASRPEDLLGAQGIFARIAVRPIRPTAETHLRFLFAKKTGVRSTGVQFLGQDVLGDPDVLGDGAVGVKFSVLPGEEPAAEVTMGE